MYKNIVQSPERARPGERLRGNKKHLAKDSGRIRQNMASSSNQEGKATKKQNLESVFIEKTFKEEFRAAIFTNFQLTKYKS